MQTKAMGYVQFPRIAEPHIFKMFTATLKRACTKVTHTPKTPQDCKSVTMRDTRPKGQPAPKSEDTRPKGQLAPKSESSRATQEKQSKQTDEPVIPKLNGIKTPLN